MIMPDILKNLLIDRQHGHDVTICSNQIHVPAILEVKTLHFGGENIAWQPSFIQ